MTDRYSACIVDYVILLRENLRETSGRRNFAGQDELDYITAKETAYREMLDALRDCAREQGLPLQELGL